jgi:ankyrin repeat protein
MTAKQKSFLDAAAKGKVATISSLLKAGVDVNTQDTRGCPTNRTALMHAAEGGYLEAVDLLISAGARINAIDKGFPADCPGGNTALLLAVGKGHLKIAHRLLDAGASPKTKGGGTSVFNAAAYLGDLALVKRLIELGASCVQRDGSGFTPIASAVLNGRRNVVELLLDLGAEANSQSPGGAPVLKSAVYGGDVELCKLLVDRGANPNVGDNDDFTPLMMACSSVQDRVVDYLLSLGVAVNKKDNRGRTALDITEHMQRPPDYAPEVLARLTKLGQITMPPAEKLLAIVSMLVKAGGKNGLALGEK